MKKRGIRTLPIGICLCWLSLPIANLQATAGPEPSGLSGKWVAITVSSLCEDTQRCAEWIDDEPGGETQPGAICCVEVSDLPNNLFTDCRKRFPLGLFPR